MLKIDMTIDDALKEADLSTAGLTFHQNSKGMLAALAVLAETVRNQRSGEYICGKCGLRQNKQSENDDPQF